MRPGGPLLDQPQPEMHVAEQPALVGGRERRPARELERPPDIVDERRRQHQLRAQPRMELRRLAAERRDADRVLEQPAGVGVVVVERRRIGGEIAIGEHRRHGRREPRMRDLGDEELEEALELGGIAAHRRREARRVDVGRLERPHVELEPVAELLDPSRARGPRRPRLKRPSSSSTSFQTRASMCPLGSTSSSAR